MLQDVPQSQISNEPPQENVVERRSALDYWLWATLVFMLLMVLANLFMAGIATLAIPPKIYPSFFFGASIALSFFLLVIGFQKSFIIFCFLRNSFLKFVLQEPLESVDYWTRDENIAWGRKIGHLCTNIFLCTVSLYFTAVVFQFFYANVFWAPHFGITRHEYHGQTLCMLALQFFILHSAVLADAKLFREQNKRYKYPNVPFWNIFVPYFVMNVCIFCIIRNIHLTFFPSNSCC